MLAKSAPDSDAAVKESGLFPKSGEAHVYVFRLTTELADNSVLNAEELDRANRFHFPVHRRRFVAGRAALRRVLGRWLGMEVERVPLASAAHGKPLVAGYAKLQFSVSHSEDVAALALSWDTPIGVDVERVRSLSDMDAMSHTIFNPEEQAQLRMADGAINVERFYWGWTRKEACLKAIGVGLSRHLHSITMDLREDFPRIVSVDGCAEATRWSMANLFPAESFVGSVAVCAPAVSMHLRAGLPL